MLNYLIKNILNQLILLILNVYIQKLKYILQKIVILNLNIMLLNLKKILKIITFILVCLFLFLVFNLTLLHPIGFEPIFNCFDGKRFSNLAKDVTELQFVSNFRLYFK